MLEHIEITPLFPTPRFKNSVCRVERLLEYVYQDTEILSQYPDLVIQLFQTNRVIFNDPLPQKLRVVVSNEYIIQITFSVGFPYLYILDRYGNILSSHLMSRKIL